ncbi:sensor histidine kinase [Bacillus sp. EB01]|uniref:sensor histidine kinase n=1 Tax=Bacillus sp. EB01 TaxID=1347086 RepID=UPI0005C75733|nr:HAMP domain-containing sensor histidine kinase [Bacillus sp. EB01]
MNKISFKIGFFFFLAIFLLETILMVALHNNIIHSRVHDELSALQTRGNNHREILEENFHEETIRHIALMESRTDTIVILADSYGTILMSSNEVVPAMEAVMSKRPDDIPEPGMILEDDWKDKPFIASASPVDLQDGTNGTVFMFQGTEKIKELISGMNQHFLIAGLLSLLFMIGVIFFLSRFLTEPLVQMNEATKKIRKGDFSVTLPKRSRDEVGELGESIEILAHELDILKNERNDFLGSISHELRTPLTYIKGYAEIAQRKELEPAERNKYLTIITEEAGKLAKLVKELFNLARIDENTFSIDKLDVELKPYLEGIFSKAAPAFNDKQMNLDLICPENISVSIDPIRFEQVIINLIENARKYSDPGSMVSVTVSRVEGNRQSEHVRIAVRDRGWGIPKEDVPRIFERFYRVDKSRTRALGGSGLGLAIAKELVEAHGSTISVSSEQGQGTEFVIEL